MQNSPARRKNALVDFCAQQNCSSPGQEHFLRRRKGEGNVKILSACKEKRSRIKKDIYAPIKEVSAGQISLP